jgi:CheY-like chemotaxis protein
LELSNIQLSLSVEPNIPAVKGDLNQLQQCVINLIFNAIDAMPDGGRLALSGGVDTKHKQVTIHVKDTGTGIPEKDLSHIFEPFFTTKEVGKGTGLGLATVYGIVRKNGGYIEVYSELGQGTTFKIYIPRIMEKDEVREKSEEASLVSGSGTVLLVEDDDMVRRMTSAMLKKIGYNVVAAQTPMDALSFCEKEDVCIDILLTDVVMPEMSGKELRDKIKRILPNIKVLFMSGYTADVILHHGVMDDGVYFVQKPFSLNDLARKIRDAVEDG